MLQGIRGKGRAVIWAGALLWCLAGPTGAQTSGTIQIAIEEVQSNPGDTVEVGVRLLSNAPQPAVIVLFIRYDPAKLTPFEDFYEFVLRDLSGAPQRDSNGNAIVRRSAVRPEAALDAAGKMADAAFHPAEGVIGISMAGLNNEPIGQGLLFTVAFQVDESALSTERLELRGVEEVDPVILADQVTFSTAAADEFDQSVTRLGVAISDGAVQMGCFPPAVTPTDLTATMDRGNEVLLSWAPSNFAVEYRVFRSETPDIAEALALGSTWTTETSFADVTARQPDILDPGGCFRDPVFEPVRYFYWVKARSAQGCESGFSAPAEGFRTGAKAWFVVGAAVHGGASGSALIFGLVVAVLLAARRGRSVARGPAS